LLRTTHDTIYDNHDPWTNHGHKKVQIKNGTQRKYVTKFKEKGL